jgi:hypothetical protein
MKHRATELSCRDSSHEINTYKHCPHLLAATVFGLPDVSSTMCDCDTHRANVETHVQGAPNNLPEPRESPEHVKSSINKLIVDEGDEAHVKSQLKAMIDLIASQACDILSHY